jgi:hypothetical protein
LHLVLLHQRLNQRTYVTELRFSVMVLLCRLLVCILVHVISPRVCRCYCPIGAAFSTSMMQFSQANDYEFHGLSLVGVRILYRRVVIYKLVVNDELWRQYMDYTLLNYFFDCWMC